MCLQKTKTDFNNYNKNKNENPLSGKYKNKKSPIGLFFYSRYLFCKRLFFELDVKLTLKEFHSL